VTDLWKTFKSPRAAARYDIVEMVSGLLLVFFMWGHMLMLSTILFGEETMNGLAGWLERYYLAQAGAVGLVFVILFHFFTAGRKLPSRIHEQKTFWRLARSIRHGDTWLWLVQAISGMMILLFAAIHLWVILTTFPIEAAKSCERVAEHFVFIYAPMVLVVELHVGIGLYRIVVKWTAFSRRAGAVLKWGLTAAFLFIGYWVLYTFWQYGTGRLG
jgi:fumarate reductase subunit C